MITKAIKHITIGQTKRLYKPVGYTMLANFINIVPFCLSIEVINTLFKAFDGTGTPLNISKLWGLIVIMFVYIIFMIFGEKKSYNANFREAYNISAEGRIALAEHLRKLSLGFLYKKDSVKLQPITHGGEQEEKRRAGTENLPAICAMAEVAQFHHEHLAEEQAQIQAISQHFLDVLSQQQVRYQVNGDEANKLPQVWNLSFNQVNNQMLLMHLDLANMAISTGSACTAGNVNPSHVLEAMYGKKDEKIHTAIRVSFGLGNTLDEVGQLAQQLGQVVRKFQQA